MVPDQTLRGSAMCRRVCAVFAAEVRAVVAVFVLFSPAQPGYVCHAEGWLTGCRTLTTVSVSCSYNLFIATCTRWVF